jgi:hypothetical protein
VTSCCQCGATVSDYGPKGSRTYCSNTCANAWDDAHPEEAAAWIRVENMTPIQRAELDAMLGLGAKC